MQSMARGALDPKNVPVVLFLFKRKETVLSIIDRVRGAAPKKVYLLSDGGRNEIEQNLVDEVRSAVESAIDWPCELVKNYAQANRGVYENIALGAKWVFEREQVAVFLEDDNLPEVSFFSYCAELLDKYRDDTRILWVCGTNYLGQYAPSDDSSYVFTKHLLPCGWASWADKFNEFYDFDLKTLDSSYLVKRVKSEYGDARLYRQQLNSTLDEKARRLRGERYQSWDYHMAWSLRAHGMFGISPANNQIKNIGADEFSIHGGTSMKMEMTRRFLGMDSHAIEGPLKHPKSVLTDLTYERRISHVILRPFGMRLRGSVRRRIGHIFKLPSDKSITQPLRVFLSRVSPARKHRN